MFKCPECGNTKFGNNAGPYGLIRICKECDFRFHSARDAEYLDTGPEPVEPDVEEVSEPEHDTPLEEVKPKPRRGRKPASKQE